LNPLVGETKSDDISAETRMESYQVLIDNTTRRTGGAERLPGGDAVRGPREADIQAIARSLRVRR